MGTLRAVIANLEKLAPPTFVPDGDASGVILGVSDVEKQKRVRLSTVAVCVDITIPVIIQCGEQGASL
ncbi:MAG: hypothetical protein ACFFAL_08025, partial [Promethearchaeota archaeon]